MSSFSFALAAALFYGIQPSLVKWGLLGGTPQALGTTIMTAAVIPIYYAMMVVSRRRFTPPRVDPLTLVFIALAGLTHTLGSLFHVAALRLEDVSIVQPVTNLGPLVTVAFLLLLGTERVSRNLVIGTVLVVSGSMLVITR